MTTQILLSNVRSIQLSDLYETDAAQRQAGAGELMRTLRIQSDAGEIRVHISGGAPENILLSYPKR